MHTPKNAKICQTDKMTRLLAFFSHFRSLVLYVLMSCLKVYTMKAYKSINSHLHEQPVSYNTFSTHTFSP